MRTRMMGGSPALVVPELADVPASARDGDDAYRPLRTVVLVAWVDDGRARLLDSAEEVTAAADVGDVVVETTDGSHLSGWCWMSRTGSREAAGQCTHA